MSKRTQTALTSVFLVRSEHLNHQGHLFGGHMMSQIDTVAYCLLRNRFGQAQFVTRAANFSFEKPARLGDLVNFCARVERTGHTSIAVMVCGCVDNTPICNAEMVFVHLDAADRPTTLPSPSAQV